MEIDKTCNINVNQSKKQLDPYVGYMIPLCIPSDVSYSVHATRFSIATVARK